MTSGMRTNFVIGTTRPLRLLVPEALTVPIPRAGRSLPPRIRTRGATDDGTADDVADHNHLPVKMLLDYALQH